MYLNYDDIRSNYEFKFTTKILRQKFPWIKDLIVPEEYFDLERYSLIFVVAKISIDECAEMYDWEISMDEDAIRRLNMPLHLATIFDISFTEDKEVMDELKQEIKKVHDSPALPNEFKFGRNLKISILGFTV